MYLLDTHIVLWCLSNDPLLSPRIKALIEDPNHLVFVSAVSAWEVAIKTSLGKLKMPDDFEKTVLRSGFELLPISFSEALSVSDLPLHHTDPFDRLLVAQAKARHLTLITQDEKILAYPIKILENTQFA